MEPRQPFRRSACSIRMATSSGCFEPKAGHENTRAGSATTPTSGLDFTHSRGRASATSSGWRTSRIRWKRSKATSRRVKPTAPRKRWPSYRARVLVGWIEGALSAEEGRALAPGRGTARKARPGRLVQLQGGAARIAHSGRLPVHSAIRNGLMISTPFRGGSPATDFLALVAPLPRACPPRVAERAIGGGRDPRPCRALRSSPSRARQGEIDSSELRVSANCARRPAAYFQR